MTTSQSPLRVLKGQADNIAKMIKAAERGEKIDTKFAEKIGAARKGPGLKFAVVMDDKTLTIEMTWATILAHSEVALAAYILKLMRGARETLQ